MASLPVQDLHGNVIGAIALYDEAYDTHAMMLSGLRFELMCVYTKHNEQDTVIGYLLKPLQTNINET